MALNDGESAPDGDQDERNERNATVTSIMNRSDLIQSIKRKQEYLSIEDIRLSVHHIMRCVSGALANGERVEIRGFGSFSTRLCPPRKGRNPKTGENLMLPARHNVRFKPGKALRQRVDNGRR